jgi:hypothetical protein
MYRPKEANHLNTPIRLEKRITTIVSGAPEFNYEDAQDEVILCSFKTYGGTDSISNGSLVILNTATIVTWYRQDIQGTDRIILLHDNSIWEVIGEPAKVDMLNQFLIFKVQKVSGGA